MNYYETLYIVHPALDAGRLKDIIMGVEDSLKKMGGDPLAVELLGKRKLAYFIDKQKYGTYVLLQFNGEGKCTGDFAVELEHNPNILAYLTTSIEKDKVIKQEEDIETQIAGKTREVERSEARKSEEKETDVAKTENLASDSADVKKGNETPDVESEQIDSATEEKDTDYTEDETPEESNDSEMDEEVDSPIEEKSDVQMKDEERSAEITESESDEKNTASEDFAEKESETNQEKAEDEPTAVSEEE